MAQTWDLLLYTNIVSVTGVGDNLSQGVGTASAVQVWDVDYNVGIVAVTGVGNNISEGVGNVASPQIWHVDYEDGAIAVVTGVGNNLSQGVGTAGADNLIWYSITARTVIKFPTDAIVQNVETEVGIPDRHTTISVIGGTGLTVGGTTTHVVVQQP